MCLFFAGLRDMCLFFAGLKDIYLFLSYSSPHEMLLQFKPFNLLVSSTRFFEYDHRGYMHGPAPGSHS